MPSKSKNRKPREVLTTGQVAQILGCAQRTAAKLMDTADFPGYHVPLSKDRRVTVEDFESYLGGYPKKERRVLIERLRRFIEDDYDHQINRQLRARAIVPE